MKFGNPLWLWALFVVPLAFVFLWWDSANRAKRFSSFAEKTLWRQIAPEYDPSARPRKGILWVLALAFALISLARPQWGTHEENVRITGIDVVIALDLSASMEVEDIVPSRLGKARHLVRNLLERMQGDRVGLVAFAGSAVLASPLTTDMSYVQETLEIIKPATMGTQGSLIGLGLELAKRTLERGAENSGKQQGSPPSKAVIVISDGEEHEPSAAAVAKQLNEAGARVYAIGVGTEKGGPIPTRDAQGNLFGYKRSKKGDPVISTFHPKALQSLAEAGGGRYWNASDQEGEVQALVEELKGLTQGELGERSYVVYEERFQIPLALALILLLAELSVPSRKITRAAILAFFTVAAVGADFGSSANAHPLQSYTHNQEGLEAYKRGEYEEAKRKFGEAQAFDPTTPELEYNRGGAQFRQGDPKGAEEAFGAAAKRAKEAKNEGLAGRALFNLGVAQAKNGDAKGALGSYISAVESARKSKDNELEMAARKNLELLVQQQQQQQKEKQQQQQQQQDQQQKKDEKKDSDQNKQEQSQQDKKQADEKPSDPEKDQGKDQQKAEGDSPEKPKDQADKKEGPVQDPRESRRRFNSKTLTPSDAERVMAELGNKERALREQLNQQKGAPKRGSLPDW